VVGLLERHLHQRVPERVRPLLPPRLDGPVEIAVLQRREEGLLLRDHLLHVRTDARHRRERVEIPVVDFRVGGVILGGDVQPAVVDLYDVEEDVLHRFVGRFAILQDRFVRQLRERVAIVAEDPPVVLIHFAEVIGSRHDRRERGHLG